MALTVKQKLDIDRMNEASARAGGISSMLSANKIMATVAFGAFTDSTGVTGTYDLTEDIPIGAIVYMAVLEPALVGFAGDTTATIQVGDGSDADRYSTGTPDVFSDVAGGIGLGVPSGVQYHAVAKTPKITITAGSDWGLVTAGSVSIAIYYFM